LVAETVLPSAIGALPCNAITGHAPQILVHAILANSETAAAPPAEHEFFATAYTLLGGLATPSSWTGGVGVIPFHFLLIACQDIKYQNPNPKLRIAAIQQACLTNLAPNQ
jgi:hypothetical protein